MSLARPLSQTAVGKKKKKKKSHQLELLQAEDGVQSFRCGWLFADVEVSSPKTPEDVPQLIQGAVILQEVVCILIFLGSIFVFPGFIFTFLSFCFNFLGAPVGLGWVYARIQVRFPRVWELTAWGTARCRAPPPPLLGLKCWF